MGICGLLCSSVCILLLAECLQSCILSLTDVQCVLLLPPEEINHKVGESKMLYKLLGLCEMHAPAVTVEDHTR